ncbi:Excinuclease ABC, C subunit, partial [Prunus dulcis]
MEKNAELERGVPRLVINYKPLNSVLEWIRYPIPNKRDLINRLEKAVVFSKFDMKSGFWQIQMMSQTGIKLHLLLLSVIMNGMSCRLNIMNDIFNPYSHFSIVYIDDVLIFSESVEQHWKHLHKFLHIVKQNGLVVSAKKIKLFQTNIRFLGFNICQSQISPIDRVIQFADKFPDQILDKSQLQ